MDGDAFMCRNSTAGALEYLAAAGSDWLDIEYIPFSAYCQGMHFYIQSVRTAFKVSSLRKAYCNISQGFLYRREEGLREFTSFLNTDTAGR